LIGTEKSELLRINPETNQVLSINSPVRSRDVILYVSASPTNEEVIAITTEFKSVYETMGRGKTWNMIAEHGEIANLN